MQCDKPPQWSFMNIIPVPKSGDLAVTDNYRGISLTCITAKIFNRLILNSIREVNDLKLWKNLNGFRTKRTTVSQILPIQRIIEGVKNNNKPAVINFLSPRRSQRQAAVTLTDLDLADDIALLLDKIEQAQSILSRVQIECQKVGLALNAKKTKYITYNIDTKETALKTYNIIKLEKVEVSNTWDHGLTGLIKI